MTRFAVLAALAACSSPSSERTYWLDELHLQQYIDLPVDGDGKLVVSKSLIDPADWSTVRGHAIFLCEHCTLGDDRATLPAPAALDPGIYFGHLTFDSIDARADFADGKVHARASVQSTDLELEVRVDGTLAKQVNESTLGGCIRFRPTDALRGRDPKMHTLLEITGAERDDIGWFHIMLQGRPADLKWRAKRCDL
jgi:hypothetical protein